MDSYIKVGSHQYKIENGVLVEQVEPKDKSIVSEAIFVAIIYLIFGKQIAVFTGVNTLVNRIVKFIV